MKHWENIAYRVDYLNLDDSLRRHSEDGWELVGAVFISPSPHEYCLFFKRPVVNDGWTPEQRAELNARFP